MRFISVLCRCCEVIMHWFGYNGIRWLWERIVRHRTALLSLFFVPVFVYRVLTYSKKDGNESEARDDNTRPLENSLDDEERSYDKGEERERNWTGSNQYDRVETVNETVHPNESEIRTENEVDKGRKSGRNLPGQEEEEDFDSREYRVDTTDEFYCDHDSTWETDRNEESPPSRTRWPTNSKHFSRFERAARDMQNYRRDYPNQIETQRWKKSSNDKPNLNFYLGKTPSLPDGVYITEFHDKWYGDYERLEYVHTYIQWLFPLREPGMNYEASTLTKEEIKDFLNHSTAKENLLKSYELMLDFYGVVLCDKKTGEVRRAKHWKERFNNLNSHTHNSLRITRILKCLGNLGYPHYQAPLVLFFLEETLVNGLLPNIRDSVLNYFMFAVLDKRQRRNLIKYAYLKYEPKDEFVWCPKKIQKLWSVPSKPTKKEADDSLESQEETQISDSEEEETLSPDMPHNNGEYESHEDEDTVSHSED